ncbi:MAG: DUF3108 domain-containing protein [Bacteroidales bacterium]|nr:DUF3108 domain-containing protein [Bacteroidales bacterium]
MKPLFRFLLAAALLAGTALSASAQGKCLPSRPDGVLPWMSGEQLEYAISYNWHAVQTDVARGILSVGQENLNGERVWHSKLSVKTAPFFDVFFKLREGFESWFALQGMEPRQFLRDSREGDYFAVNRYLYDRRAGLIHAALSYPDENKTVDIPYGACTYDVTTLFSYARQMDYDALKQGARYNISFAIDDKVQVLTLTYRGKENKYVKGVGTVATRKFGLSLLKGEVFEGDEDAVLWFSDDDNRVLVAFMAPLKVGAMNGRLKSYGTLAHPFDALISTKKVK